MNTSCAKCHREVSLESYKQLDHCPQCGYDFNRKHYSAALFMSCVFAGPIYLFGYEKYGRPVAFIAAGILTMGIVTIIGDLVLRANKVDKERRRRIVGWVSILSALAVAAAGRQS